MIQLRAAGPDAGRRALIQELDMPGADYPELYTNLTTDVALELLWDAADRADADFDAGHRGARVVSISTDEVRALVSTIRLLRKARQ